MQLFVSLLFYVSLVYIFRALAHVGDINLYLWNGSVSSLMTTTEAIVTELPKDDKEGAATAGGMGGLDY